MRNKLGWILAIALALASPSYAFDRQDFDRIADFSVTIKTLAGLPEPGRLAGRLLLLDGTVASMQLLDPDEATFAVELELAGGEWIGTEDVKIYLCRVRFRGREYFRLFPRRVLHHGGHFRAPPFYLADEALHRTVAVVEGVIFPEVLPDPLGAQPFVYRCLDDLTVRLTGAL
jgi:hypothetical protein